MRYYSTHVFFLCSFVTAAISAPWPSTVPICAEECPITDAVKLRYRTDKTYTYKYSGKSQVELKGVNGAVTESHWEKTVLLSWLSPCEMAITFKDVKIDGNTPSGDESNFLARYPLVVALTDGRVQRVCSHPSDEPWAINLKKGVATAFQNLLPTLSTLSSPVNFTETDLSGRCPTQYIVEKQSETVTVTKIKDHRQCLDQYVTPAETPKIWLKAPVPIERSWTTCKQEITNSIYSSITCRDKAVLRPSVGAYKHIEANQESTLHFVSENEEAPESLSTIRGEYDYGSLLYDHRPSHKNTAFTTLLEERLKELCEKTRQTVAHESASIMSDIIQVMKRVPDRDFPQVLEKIRQGQICPQIKRLESLYLHAIAFTHESGSVKIIIDELLKGTTPMHTTLYASALYNTHHPDFQSLKEIKRLFASNKYLPTAWLSAASMVNNFCRHNHECHRETEVADIINTLNSKIQQQCAPCDDDETKNAAFATLESIGNIGVMTPEVSKSALKCIETKGVENSIRIAAIRSFRNAKCQRYATLNFVKIAVDHKRNDELRIASYLAAMRCAEKEDVEEIILKISKEDNTQVRSFVLSHILNIQKSTNPEKKHLKYLLSDFVIPSNYTQDFRRYSQNIDTTFYEPSLGLGGGVENNIIYGPGSFVPRSVALNFTSMLYGQSFNLGQIGGRFEGVDGIMENILAPSSLFPDTSQHSAMKNNGDSILEKIVRALQKQKIMDSTPIGEMLKKIYEEGASKVPYVELYANIMGQDIAYKILKGNIRDMDFGNIMDGYISTMKDVFSKDINAKEDFSHMTQIALDYYLPTGHGTPLKMKFTGTAILGIEMEGKLNLNKLFSKSIDSENRLKMIPGLSVEANGFIGYDCFLSKTGLQMKNSLSINGGLSVSLKKAGAGYEAHIDLPENTDLIEAQSETYLMKGVVGSQEQVIIPESLRDNRIKKTFCNTEWEPMLGFKICYNMDVPDIFRNTGLPLGAKSTVKLHIAKTDPSLRGYKVKAAIHNKSGNKELNINIETKGLSTPKKTEATISYTKLGTSYNVKATVIGPNLKGGIWVTLHDEDNERNLEVFGEYESNVRKLSRGIKLEYKKTSKTSSGSIDLILFTSQSRSFPPSSKVFSLQILSRAVEPHVNMAILVKTHNAMVNIVELALQVAFDLQWSADLQVPHLKRIRRLELNLGSAGWNIISYLRHGGESPESDVVTTAFCLNHRDDEIIKYAGTHSAIGSMDRDYAMQNTLEFKLGPSGVKIHQQFFYGITKTGMVMKILPLTGSSHHLNFEAMLTNLDREHQLLLLVDIPAMTSPLRLTGLLRPSGEENAYGLTVSLLHGERRALEVTGPCHIKLQPQARQIETNLQIKVLNEEPLKWKSKYEFTHEKIFLLFDLANQHESLLLVEWKLGSRSLQENHMAFRFEAANFVKHRIDIAANDKQIEISTDNILALERPQRIRGDLHVYYAEYKAKFEAFWDANHDPNKKLIIDSKLIKNPSQPQQHTIVSTIDYEGKIYNANLELETDYLIHPVHGGNGLKLSLRNEEGKTLIFEGGVHRDRRGSNLKIDSHLRYKNWEDSDYKMTNLIDESRSDGRSKFEVRSEFMCKISEQGESALKVDVRSSTDSTTGREFSAKVIASVPGKHPMDVELKIATERNGFSAEAKSEATTPPEIFMWKTSLHDRGVGIKSFEVKTDFTGMADFMKKVREIVVSQEGSSSSMATYEYRGERSVYHSGYENFPTNTHTLWIHTPHRRIHAEGQVSPTVTNIHFYPDKNKGDERYEIQLLATVSEGTMDSPDRHQWHARVRHPHFPRDKTVTIEIANKGAGIQGKLEIDILPDAADKLTGTITSRPQTEDSTYLSAELSARILESHPVITAVIGHAPHSVGFDVSFKKAPTQPVSFMMVGKYDRSTFKNNAVSFEMKSEGRPVISLTAVTKVQMKSQCYGTHIRAFAVTSFLGSYNIEADACKPLYLEVSANKQGDQKMYIGKFGLENPNKVEFSLSTKVKGTNQNSNAFLARIMLTPPTMLKLQLDYKSEETKTLLNYLREKTDTTATSIQSWIQRIKEALQEAARAKQIPFPSPALSKEWEIIVHEATAIFHDVRDNKIHPAYVRIKNFFNSPSVSYVINAYSKAWIKMAEIRRSFTEQTTHKILSMTRVFKEAYSPVIKGLKDLAHMMRTAEVPEFILNLRRKCEESRLYQKVQAELHGLGEKYPTLYNSLQEVWIKLRDELLVDLEKLRVKFLTIPPFVDFINWITIEVTEDHMANLAANMIVDRILQETVYVTVETHPGYVGIDIPIREELYSLNQVLHEVWPYPTKIIRNIIWSYDTYITQPIQNIIKIVYSPSIPHLRNYLPPFNGTAMLIGNNEVLTFDGEIMRIPKTPCEIILAHIGNTKLTFKRQVHQQHPTVTLVYKHMKVIVQPNFRVVLNGHTVSEHEEMEGLAIKNTQYDVYITTPVLSVYMAKNLRILEVEASGWDFGNVAGIMGTFDGERANDWLMPTGVVAHEVRQFVNSWQEDHNCRTPAIVPVHIPTSRIVTCHALVGMRSRCNPIVDPHPFIKMCREVENPCDAAKAYRHLCSRRGVVEPYPHPC
ncbi:vitellogenin-like [Palaemon carinicauda]|uniref:vitellogenin-like n=1 Tax=Palaemon carinicauda TaxID=392227 RepID=UPI0030853083|nr:vitellogenin 2 [Palaemon carinicauda]